VPRTTTTTPKDSKMSESTKQSLIWAISATVALLSLFIWVVQLVTLANENDAEKMQVCVQQDMQWVSGNCIGKNSE
jgi:hypothetical protein